VPKGVAVIDPSVYSFLPFETRIKLLEAADRWDKEQGRTNLVERNSLIPLSALLEHVDAETRLVTETWYLSIVERLDTGQHARPRASRPCSTVMR
jgi:hypothetical protein